ncbi:MAG: FtsX-like permease family protein [Candidatus Limiplasma sp.]|nr:FtsX-like permease family protein [Candidatus Limiplasma sp.]
MTKFLYLRLALNNLRKNKQTYLPFLLAATMLTFTVYSFLMIAFNPGLSQVHGGAQFVVVLYFGIVVIALFTVLFLFYANSFLIKRRKKEMGLYSILGMEKRHIARVLRHELTLTWLVSMVAGLGLGVLLTRLLFLLIRLTLRIEAPLVGTVNWAAVWVTLGLFALLFLLLMLYNGFQVRAVSPVELLRGGQVGEKEPRARWILAVLGLLFTGAGYWIAQIVSNPMAAIALFFVAVVLVILGTYLLFLSGSIALLRTLRRNRRYYYTPRHFVTISGMLYRMKQNAAGLASIAILCTMAMITLGTTIALYNGSEKTLTEYYPSDMQISLTTPADQAAVLERNRELAKETGVQIVDEHAFQAVELSAGVSDGQLVDIDTLEMRNLNDYSMLHSILLLTPDQFALLEGAAPALAANEIAYSTNADDFPGTLALGDTVYALQKLPPLAVIPCRSQGTAFHSTLLVVPDEAALQAVMDAANLKADDRTPVYTVQWNVQGTQAQLDAYYSQPNAGNAAQGTRTLRVKVELREEWYAMYGGFLFVGVFLGFVFLLGTALIIYFKQISEGYQDHDRFVILQQVGMSNLEVRATVRRQILLVFFLPLLVAVCHVAGSLHMMTLMLFLFGLTDVPYIALNTFLAAVGVAALYWLFYGKTAKTYYRMVKF